MENIFGAGEELVDGSEVANIARFHHQIRVSFSMRKVLESPTNEIVDDVDAKTLVQ
jgi:hypothetical protein